MNVWQNIVDRLGKPQETAERISAKAAFYGASGAGIAAGLSELSKAFNMMAVNDGPVDQTTLAVIFVGLFGVGCSLWQDVKHHYGL